MYNKSDVTAALTDFDIPSLETRLTGQGFRSAHGAMLLKALYRGNGSIDLESLSLGKQLIARMTDDANVTCRNCGGSMLLAI